MLKAAQRAADLTGQLLAFSRRQVLQPREVDLGEVVRGMERMLRQLLGENVELLTSLDPDLEKVEVDPGRIEQVLLTLALNARDAMPTGGRMTVRTGHVEVDPGPLADDLELAPGRYVSLAVSDTGVGIEPGLRDKIFEPFFTTKDHGTGLGLASVYGIVRQSGGAVRVESQPGAGATFTVLVPLPKEEGGALPAAPEEAATATAPRGELAGSETVLVVEDQPELRQLLALMLGHRGYRVLTAGDAEGALAVADRHDGNVDLLLTDVVLPGLSGRQLADRLRAEQAETRVIYMSGYTDEVVLRHGVEEGGLTFVQKPFDEETLLTKVRQLLDHPERSA
jgi:CheY-like chemotaxis protein